MDNEVVIEQNNPIIDINSQSNLVEIISHENNVEISNLINNITIEETMPVLSLVFNQPGSKGDKGTGIKSIEKTSTVGLIDTYTITYTDDTTSEFEVTNGKDGIDGDDGYTPYIESDYWYINGVNTGIKAKGDKGDTGDVGSINSYTDKTTPVDTDYTLIEDNTNVKKKLSWANIKATLKTYFDTLYNNYVHPANHLPSIISQDSSNRFVTDTEKLTWNGKQSALISGTNIKTINSGSILGSGDIALPTATSTTTLTNKRITSRIYSTATTNTITPEVSTYDIWTVTALASALTINNHSTSTPTDGERMLFRILDNASPRNIYYGNKYVAKAGIPLPLITVASKNLTMLFEWNANLSEWNLLAVRSGGLVWILMRKLKYI